MDAHSQWGQSEMVQTHSPSGSAQPAEMQEDLTPKALWDGLILVPQGEREETTPPSLSMLAVSSRHSNSTKAAQKKPNGSFFPKEA